MLYESYEKGVFQVIKFNEVLHLTSNISKLETVVSSYLEKEIVNIALRFKEESYLCSQTGAIIVRCWEEIKDHGGEFALININNDILDFLKVIDFESLIKIFSSEKDLVEIE